MLQESMNNYFITAAVAVAVIAILINLFYLFETSREINIIEYQFLANYVNIPFVFSLSMLIILWVTTYNLDVLLFRCFWGITIGWLVTTVVALIVSVFAKVSVEYKQSARRIIKSSVLKVIIMVTAMWIIY